MKIDAHQHFWALSRGDYGWLTPGLTPLYRDFQPADLAPLLKRQGIGGAILVQAAPTLGETHYMLELAAAEDFIKGVVGWVDFASPDAPEVITDLAQNRLLVGLRPMIQDIADDDWMLGDMLTPAFRKVVETGLVFDALTLPRHLPNLIKLLDRHPDLNVVIDHGSKPAIARGDIVDWAAAMKTLADGTKVSVKLSGLVTEAGADWTPKTLRPYVDFLLKTFGPSRMIWGSDWPVCTLACTYEKWCETTKILLGELGDADVAAIMGGNAIQTYQLNVSE